MYKFMNKLIQKYLKNNNDMTIMDTNKLKNSVQEIQTLLHTVHNQYYP